VSIRRVLAALLVLLIAPVAHAHELGKTHVTARFDASGEYVIDIAADPQALLAKLQIIAGETPSVAVMPPADIAARINALQRVLIANTRVTFSDTDGAAADANPLPADAPAFIYAAGPPPGGLVRLTGRVPAGARSVRFAYDLILGAYPLTIGDRTIWLAGGQASEPFALDATSGRVSTSGAAPSRVHIARQYLVLGFEHIVPKGLDHILFVLGIFLLTAAWRPMMWQVTTFTIAHSITLGLTIYGLVSVPSSIVEPLIALSITYVAVENLFTSTLKPTRVALVFAFGLLHGMGFAGVLKDLGLPRSEFLTALVTFNLGVEGGQLAVIAVAFLAIRRWRRWAVMPASATIALVGVYWTITRALTALALG
jgi:hydrogenase/urease accessory protein HupE